MNPSGPIRCVDRDRGSGSDDGSAVGRFLTLWFDATLPAKDCALLATAVARVAATLTRAEGEPSAASSLVSPAIVAPISALPGAANPETICALTLTEARDQIQTGELSAGEVIRSSLVRAERLNDPLALFIELERERALADVSRLDPATRPGALHGIPIAHKDTIAHRGRAPSCGSLLPLMVDATRTAPILDRLEAEGAIDLGGLNTSDSGLNPFGMNRLRGPARNPWNPAHVAGGSSSGPAAAVAAGVVKGSIGSDTGGSIRIPAAFCNVVGLKPSSGALSNAGILPLSTTLDTPGPLARTVADCALLFAALEGSNPTAFNLSAPLAGRRIGVPRHHFLDEIDSDVEGAFFESLRVFTALGAVLVDVTIDDVALMSDVLNVIVMAEGAHVHRRWLIRHRDSYTTVTRNALEFGLAVPAERYLAALAFRQRRMATVPDLFAKVDVVAAPTTPCCAPSLERVTAFLAAGDRLPFDLGRNTRPANLLGLPAITLPCGFDSAGLPIGLQLMAAANAEAILFNVGHAFQAVTDFHKRQPPFCEADGGTSHQPGGERS